MKSFSATDLKNKTGLFVESILKEPVEIQKSGRTIAVAIPKEEYERLVEVENRYWAERAKAAEARGYATESQIKKLLSRAKDA